MVNKIKIWINRNFFKYALICFLVFGFFYFLKMSNQYYKEKKEEKMEMIDFISVKDIEEEVEEDEIEEEEKKFIEDAKNSLIRVDKNSDEYKQVYDSTIKIINLMYKIKLNPENEDLRKSLYNLYSKEAITGEEIDVSNIEKHILDIENTENFSVGSIHRYNEENNVVIYIIKLNHTIENNFQDEVFMIIDMDYNNKTFAYDGEIESIDEIAFIEVIENIEKNDNNSF